MQPVLGKICKIVRGEATEDEKLEFLRNAFVVDEPSGRSPQVDGWCTVFYYFFHANGQALQGRLIPRPQVLQNVWDPNTEDVGGKNGSVVAGVDCFPICVSRTEVELKRRSGDFTAVVEATTAVTVTKENRLTTNARVTCCVDGKPSVVE